MLPCSAVAAPPKPLLRPSASDASSNTALVPGCLSVIATCAVVGVAALYTLPTPPSHEPLGPRLFATAIGLFGGMGLQSVYSMARGFGRGKNSRAALMARAGARHLRLETDSDWVLGLARVLGRPRIRRAA